MQPDHLILIGDFAPLTLSMLADINHAAGLSKTLHIIIQTPNHAPLPCGRTPTLADAVRWVQMACQSFGFIKIHTFGSLALPDMSFDYRNNTQLTKHQFLAICQALNITAHTTMLGIKSSHKDTLHPFELALPKYGHASNYDDELVQNNPLAYFHQLSAVCRYFYTQTVCIVGGESSGKTTLVQKLANDYGASIAPEMGRLYTHSHLGGSELALQYSDYASIAINHANSIETARTTASSAVTLIDTDFATTQAFCEIYEGQTHPLVAEFAKQMRLDFTIYLDNNVAWVADGMRRLGDDHQRSLFANKLLEILARYDIGHHIINDTDYHKRYLQALSLIDHNIFNHFTKIHDN
ncbi:multifunctional transcriptional regulator/nicotinamide-nucleotide adenylyltransferase/ribosylnicotinamide kinase NadR [Moraxella catarrhalis]|uniref:multifunctional transcriptional regulator/nicotinamide-nucleotide adenylyltransferase/ribosylnicotinamide kinase NadR n=1 Tax=Moraxella catarrhalis TaxID=480 RepID=UPI00128B0334|nr:multifunctional transcriptional regulator/nicotinamide-nucleotide adenylyltransferase/ribosylnicotinamide kinase NadR [Moraxella catarrhalis]MPX23716.1 multifunctional transcriptional regulator/nicotinamide-nucleotide adenylyltransferase/ribosylnicotinamide kinase NadR [Moraxella catarrhalis]